MEPFTNSVLRCHPFFLMLSTGYTLMAIDFLPLGKLILAASSTNALDAPHATSLAFVILNFHAQFGLFGLDEASFISFSPRIITVLSLFFASAQRFCCCAV